MEQKSLSQVPIQIRDSYNRAAKTSATLDVNSAIALIKDFVKKYPFLIPARERLRELEMRKAATLGFGGKFSAKLATIFKLPVIRGKINSDPMGAMGMCEDLLAKALDNPTVLSALTDAAASADAPFIGAEAMRILCKFHPDSEANTLKLIRALQANNEGKEALVLFREIAARHPDDLNMQNELRSAMALASIDHKPAAAENAAAVTPTLTAQLRKEPVVYDPEQARKLIETLTANLGERDSVEIRRRLGECYMVVENFEAAKESFEKAAALADRFDPVVDKKIENAQVEYYKQMIRELTENPGSYENPEEQINDLNREIDSYKLRHARKRSEAMPNNALLHFDYAELLFQKGDHQKAIAEFKLAERSPQKKTQSQIYLGRGYAALQQYPDAIEQFEAALKEIPEMDSQRLDIMYDLAGALKENGEPEQAMEYYRDIMAREPGYRDVEARIDTLFD